MKIQLLKAEGDWIQATLGCYVSVNNNLLDVITPLNSPHEVTSIEVPVTGILRLVIRDMGKTDGFLASLTISLDKLSPSSGIWLPLESSSTNDTITELKNSTQKPRILLSILTEFCDDELFLTNQEIEYDSISEIVLASEILTYPEPENVLLKTSNFNFGQDSNDKKQQEIIEILNLEIENYRQLIEKEKEINENLKLRISAMLESIKHNSERTADRENSLLELVSEKEAEITKIMEMNRKLQNNVRKIEFEKKTVEEKLERVNSQLEFMQSVEKELAIVQGALKNSENNVEKLSKMVIKLSIADNYEKNDSANLKDLSNCIVNGEKSINLGNTLKEKTMETVKEENSEDSRSLQKSYIKELLKNSIQKFTEIKSITEINEFVYKVNEIELIVAVTNDGIYIKHGLQLLTIEDFWHNRCKHAIRHSEIPNITGKLLFSNEKGTENDIKKHSSKVSPKKFVLKPVCNLQKYTSVLNRSPSKDTKLSEKKKLHK